MSGRRRRCVWPDLAVSFPPAPTVSFSSARSRLRLCCSSSGRRCCHRGILASCAPSQTRMQAADEQGEEGQHDAHTHMSPAMHIYRHALESIFAMLDLSDLSRVLAVSREWSAAVRSMKPIHAMLERAHSANLFARSYSRPLPSIADIVGSSLLRRIAMIQIKSHLNWSRLDNASLGLLAQRAPHLTSLGCCLTWTPTDPFVLPVARCFSSLLSPDLGHAASSPSLTESNATNESGTIEPGWTQFVCSPACTLLSACAALSLLYCCCAHDAACMDDGFCIELRSEFSFVLISLCLLRARFQIGPRFAFSSLDPCKLSSLCILDELRLSQSAAALTMAAAAPVAPPALTSSSTVASALRQYLADVPEDARAGDSVAGCCWRFFLQYYAHLQASNNYAGNGTSQDSMPGLGSQKRTESAPWLLDSLAMLLVSNEVCGAVAIEPGTGKFLVTTNHDGHIETALIVRQQCTFTDLDTKKNLVNLKRQLFIRPEVDAGAGAAAAEVEMTYQAQSPSGAGLADPSGSFTSLPATLSTVVTRQFCEPLLRTTSRLLDALSAGLLVGKHGAFEALICASRQRFLIDAISWLSYRWFRAKKAEKLQWHGDASLSELQRALQLCLQQFHRK